MPKLESMRGMLNERLPEHSPARLLNIPLIMPMVRAVEYPDLKFTVGLVKGVDIAGDIPESDALKKMELLPPANARCGKRAS